MPHRQSRKIKFGFHPRYLPGYEITLSLNPVSQLPCQGGGQSSSRRLHGTGAALSRKGVEQEILPDTRMSELLLQGVFSIECPVLLSGSSTHSIGEPNSCFYRSEMQRLRDL